MYRFISSHFLGANYLIRRPYRLQDISVRLGWNPSLRLRLEAKAARPITDIGVKVA